MRHHDAHATRLRPHGRDHVLDPGVVSVPCWRHSADCSTPGVRDPSVSAPVLEREGWVGDDDVKLREPTLVVKELRVGERVATQDPGVFDVVEVEVHPGDGCCGQVHFLSVEAHLGD